MPPDARAPDGCCTQSTSLAELLEVVKRVAAGDTAVCAAAAPLLLRAVSRAQSSRDSALSAREQEIAALVARGLSNKQIASSMHLELSTVKNHVHRIFAKVGISRRSQLIAAIEDPDRRPLHVARLDPSWYSP